MGRIRTNVLGIILCYNKFINRKKQTIIYPKNFHLITNRHLYIQEQILII